MSYPTLEEIERAVWTPEEILCAQSPDNTFQQRLNTLLECTGASYRQIERGTRGVVRKHHVYQFRTGRSKDPNYKILAALSKFFHVPVSYFFEEVCDDEIAYLLPCLPEKERQRIRKMAVELLERQLFQFGEQTPGK